MSVAEAYQSIFVVEVLVLVIGIVRTDARPRKRGASADGSSHES